jgi:gamma-glutamyltranspeptidase/glutathione hydrolase
MLQNRMPPLSRIVRIVFLALALAALVSPHVEVRSGGRGAVAIAPAQRVTAPHGIVVAQEARAARIGMEILERGGNAVDAAVAVGFAMAVTYPRAGNIGGGGFMLIHRADHNDDVAIDYRETAPMATTRATFLDQHGNADPVKSRSSALGIGVPGTVAGLALAQQKYGSGRFSLADLIAPAIELARAGIPVEDDIADSLPAAAALFARWPAAAKIFLNGDGSPLGPGDRLVQSDLAATLAAIARDGSRAFYDGPIAEKIAAAVAANGGLMTREDLKDYRAVERAPVLGTYRGYDIVSMPPPSSGGVILIEILNMLEGYDLRGHGAQSPPALHLMIEAMQRAYADRAMFLGDPDVVAVPVKNLISKPYAAALLAGIDPERARRSQDIKPGEPPFREGDNTTHYSVVDRFGNAVSNTYTLNLSYGVGMVADGTGILLNNELDDFAAKPEAPNAYGLIGYEANAPGPGKRPLSSMTPTIVLKNGKPFLVTGSPGGSRIITTVLQVILNVIDFDMTITDAVTAPRLHHQWLPDVVFAERGFPPQTIAALEARGHKISVGGPAGSANSIAITPSGRVGAADPRTRGALAAGY